MDNYYKDPQIEHALDLLKNSKRIDNTELSPDMFLDVIHAFNYAVSKHPVFPDDLVKMVAIMAEEAGEAVREANNIDEGKGSIPELITELEQTAAMCLRCISKIKEMQ